MQKYDDLIQATVHSGLPNKHKSQPITNWLQLLHLRQQPQWAKFTHNSVIIAPSLFLFVY